MNVPIEPLERSTAGNAVNRVLWILFTVVLALNAGLSIAGHILPSIVFGIIAFALGILLLIRYVSRRAA